MARTDQAMTNSATQALNITFVIPYFYPAWEYGGQPRSAYELARALVQRGHRVKVLTTDSAGHSRLSAGHRQVDGIDVIYYRNLSNWLAFRKRFFWPQALWREMNSQINGSEILHIHELRSTLSVFAHRAAKTQRIPYVLSTHGGLKHLGRKGVKTVFDAFWGGRILRDAAAVLAISPAEEKDARDMNLRLPEVRPLPNMISLADYVSLPKKGTFKSRNGLDAGKVILFLGRLHWIKGADLLIEAFRRMADSQPDTKLIIAGSDDGQEAALRTLVETSRLKGSVKFVGFLDDRSKREALVDADLLVIPSRSEVFAITALEALMCGCRVLLSDVCGLHPMPSADHGVQLFESNNVDDLARKLRPILESANSTVVASNGRQFVISEFGSDEVSARAESIYRTVLT
jgi:glycosyltransferase involved in cell wall biosynthesis